VKFGCCDPPTMTEKRDKKFWRAVSAEFTATFLFVFLGVGCALSTGGDKLSVSLCFRLTIFALVHIFGHISGAHINPAVSWALMCARLISPLRAGLYMLAQFLGSILASAILMSVLGLKPETMGGFNSLGTSDSKVARGFWTEVILTFLLLLAVFATLDPKHGKESNGPLAIGMTVSVAHLMAVPITGCGINPARSLGPALISSASAAKEDLWVFLLAPFFGAHLAVLVYLLWFAEEKIAGGRNLVEKFSAEKDDTGSSKVQPDEESEDS